MTSRPCLCFSIAYAYGAQPASSTLKVACTLALFIKSDGLVGLFKMLSIGGMAALQELGDQMVLLQRDIDLQGSDQNPAENVGQQTSTQPSMAATPNMLIGRPGTAAPVSKSLREISEIGRALEGVVSKQHFLQLR